MTPDDRLTKEIVDVFALLAVLLVFIVAYLTYLQGRVVDEVHREIPPFESDRPPARARLRATRRLVVCAGASAVAVLLLLLPLSLRVLRALPGRRDFPTAQVGLILVDLFLVGMVTAAGTLAAQVTGRIREADEPGLTVNR